MSRMKVVDPVLKWFWKKCRAKMAKPENQRKSSWRDMTLRQLMRRLKDETHELQLSLGDLKRYPKDEAGIRREVIAEATDVANFAMMIAGKARAHPTKQGE